MENPKNSCIIGGDFNAGSRTDECKRFTERSHHKFRQWTEQLGLQNDLVTTHENNFYTFRRGNKIKTFIDHILTSNNAEFVLGGSNKSAYLDNDTDHYPVWIGVRLNDIRRISKPTAYEYKKVRRVELDLDDLVAVEALQDLLLKLTSEYDDVERLTIEEVKQMTEDICTESVKYTRLGMKKQHKRNKIMKDGWSPKYCVLCDQHTCFLEIKRHLLGERGENRWRTEEDRITGIRNILKEWLNSVDSFVWKNEAERLELINVTGKGYSFWSTKSDYKISEIELELTELDLRRHGRQRAEMRMQINLACRAREQGRIDNKLKKLIASLTEKASNNYGMETLIITWTKILTDPQANYDNLTAWFKD